MPDDEDLEAPGPTVRERPALPHPQNATAEAADSWSLVAHDKGVAEGWRQICRQIPENALRCYNWLRANPTRPIPRRCYALKGKHYAGYWAFEVGSGERVYYKPRPDRHDVLVYYAGPHPKKGIPYPPAEDEGCT